MAITLVVETGDGLETANSYATAAEGDAYHQQHLWATDWTSATQEEKESGLVWATRLLDEQVQWYGQQSNIDTQALSWPRIGVYDKDGVNLIGFATIPTWLKYATAEMARYLISVDRTLEPDSKGIKFMGAGPLQISFDKADIRGILPRSVISIVGPYGIVNSSTVQFGRIVRV